MPKIKHTKISHSDEYTSIEKFRHSKLHKITKNGKEELKNANRSVKKRTRQISKKLIDLELNKLKQ